MFRTMRRFKQELTREECLAVLRSQPRGVLSLLGENGYPYGLPIDYWYNETDGKLYFHGAKEGHKIDAIRACDKASFCIYLTHLFFLEFLAGRGLAAGLLPPVWAVPVLAAAAFGGGFLVWRVLRRVPVVKTYLI